MLARAHCGHRELPLASKHNIVSALHQSAQCFYTQLANTATCRYNISKRSNSNTDKRLIKLYSSIWKDFTEIAMNALHFFFFFSFLCF